VRLWKLCEESETTKALSGQCIAKKSPDAQLMNIKHHARDDPISEMINNWSQKIGRRLLEMPHTAGQEASRNPLRGRPMP
jgi:hypothetical protein